MLAHPFVGAGETEPFGLLHRHPSAGSIVKKLCEILEFLSPGVVDIEVVCAFVICGMWLRASLGRWLLDVRTELKVAVSILEHSHTKFVLR